MEGLEEESNCDSLERGDDSNDGSNIDSENIDSIDSLGPSDSASERVDSAVGGLLMDGDELRGESRVEGSNEDDDDVDNIDGVSGDRYTANPDQANVVDDKMVGGKVNPRENLGETVGRSSPAKVSCDIDDDEAMSVEEPGNGMERTKEQEEMEPSFDPENVELLEPHAFSPRDLLAILRSIETAIFVSESKVRDEVEKRKKYRVDDCRRVHNYDEFLTTFLAMLTEQNLLGDLVETSLGRSNHSNHSGQDGASKEKIPYGGSSEKIPYRGNNSEKIPYRGNNSEKIPYRGNNSEKIPYRGNNSGKIPYRGNSEKIPYRGNHNHNLKLVKVVKEVKDHKEVKVQKEIKVQKEVKVKDGKRKVMMVSTPGSRIPYKGNSPTTSTKHLTKTKIKKKRNISDSDGTDSTDSSVAPPIMYSDPTLPPGWKRKVKKRTGLGGGVQGKWDVFIVNPDGRKFKTRGELKNFIDNEHSGESDLDIENFDFTVSGVKRSNIKFTARKKKLMEKKKSD